MGKRFTKAVELDNNYLFGNYGNRLPVCFTRGQGDRLYDTADREYIDFFSGIAVTNLGHNHPKLTKAIQEQAEKILHTSNWFFNEEQGKAARQLSELAFPGRTLFVNSGAEANEAAIKLARRHGLFKSGRKFEIISFHGSFHGRTFGSMTATAQKKIHRGFGPLPRGFVYLPFNDLKALKKQLRRGRETAAVILEPVQGEGGIRIAEQEFIRGARELCSERNVLLIMDEVQTGMGRTGEPFAFQHFDVTPDILTLAKGLAGGMPAGAMHAREDLAEHLPGGSHGTTFGGNHLAMAAALVVLKEIGKESLMKKVRDTGREITDRLNELKERYRFIQEVRGMGLHIGMELTHPCQEMVKRSLEKGLVVNCTAGNVLRIMPPLNVKTSTVRKGMKILEELLREEEQRL